MCVVPGLFASCYLSARTTTVECGSGLLLVNGVPTPCGAAVPAGSLVVLQRPGCLDENAEASGDGVMVLGRSCVRPIGALDR